MWGDIIEKLDTAELHSEVLDVGTDSFDDDDDDVPLAAWQSPLLVVDQQMARTPSRSCFAPQRMV